jgi:hypothetical protein
MHIVTRLIALTRGYQLGRQFAFIERSIEALPPSSRAKLDLLVKTEISRAEQCEFPHLYGTPPGQRYTPWGQGTETGFTRAQSDNLEVRLRGIALWLAVVFYETRDSSYENMQPQQRKVLRVLRELGESTSRGNGSARRLATSAA